jgi:hypothetical protein
MGNIEESQRVSAAPVARPSSGSMGLRARRGATWRACAAAASSSTSRAPARRSRTQALSPYHVRTRAALLRNAAARPLCVADVSCGRVPQAGRFSGCAPRSSTTGWPKSCSSSWSTSWPTASEGARRTSRAACPSPSPSRPCRSRSRRPRPPRSPRATSAPSPQTPVPARPRPRMRTETRRATQRLRCRDTPRRRAVRRRRTWLVVARARWV